MTSFLSGRLATTPWYSPSNIRAVTAWFDQWDMSHRLNRSNGELTLRREQKTNNNRRRTTVSPGVLAEMCYVDLLLG